MINSGVTIRASANYAWLIQTDVTIFTKILFMKSESEFRVKPLSKASMYAIGQNAVRLLEALRSFSPEYARRK